MDYEREVFIQQFPRVKWFVAHLIYYRVLCKAYRERMLRNEFWTMTIDAHLLRATIDWCMVFGSDSNPTHWKKLSVTHAERLSQSFYDGLVRKTHLDRAHWREYWRQMTRFRNKWAAHRELEEYKDPVPNFDVALAVAYHYEWVRDIISPDSLEEPSLESFAEGLKVSISPLVEKLLNVTSEPL
jgi:hypothetical protein